MRCGTLRNVINQIIGTTPSEILGPNPRRKSFMLSPVAAGPGSVIPLIAVVFSPGVGQGWTVPDGVTQIEDAYAWGAGGNGALATTTGGGNPGGGGGGGGFASAGPITVAPGDVWTVSVDAAGGGSLTSLTDAAATVVASAASGGNAVNGSGSAGGAGTTGATTETGGTGANGNGGVAGGGGASAAGFGADGNNGSGADGGAAVGTATLGGYGVGGAGGNAAQPGSDVAQPGTFPGGGGGGAYDSEAVRGAGANGLAVIFYSGSAADAYVSLSQRPDVQPGLGTINYIPGATFPTTVTDCEIGDSIGDPWWIVSGANNVAVQVTEYLYAYEP